MNKKETEIIKKLKPCPFCGPSAPIALREERQKGFIGWRIKCTGPCGLAIPGNADELFTSRENAAKVWNNRIPK